MLRTFLDVMGRLIDRLWMTEEPGEREARIEAEDAKLDPATRAARIKMRIVMAEKQGKGGYR